MNNLRELRIQAGLTQQKIAEKFAISLRSYRDYENDKTKVNTLKYKYLVDQLEKITLIDEENGLLSLDFIKETCFKIFEEYSVKSCHLFGSYAKGEQNPRSDVDLFIDTDITGLEFFGLVEKLRTSLHKVVDLVDTRQVLKNPDLLSEILKFGIKIYG